MAAKCARIWCVRPVCSTASTSVQRSRRAITRQSVRAWRPLRRARGHARAAARIARNGQRDRAGIARHLAVHQRQINFPDISRTELLGEMFVRTVIPRHDHRARGFVVQAMHDARTQRAARAGKISQAVQQRVHQRAARMARARVHHHPGGLVHNDEIVVHEQQVERQIFRQRLQARAAAELRPRWFHRPRSGEKPWRCARPRARAHRVSTPGCACGSAPGHAGRETDPAASPHLPMRRSAFGGL